jgi:hypothetical protein
LAAAVGTRCRQVRSRCDLKTLAAIEAGVSDKVLGAWHVLDLQASPALRLVCREVRFGSEAVTRCLGPAEVPWVAAIGQEGAFVSLVTGQRRSSTGSRHRGDRSERNRALRT